MRRKIRVVLFACSFVTAAMAGAQSLDQEMSALATKISKALAAQGFKSVAAVDFTDLQGQPTELGRFLSDQLAVEIVSAGGVSMVDRANIKSILAEHKLTEEGLVDPANAKKLGEFAGVDAILTGTVTALDASIVLTVKAVATASSRLVAAGKISFPKTSEIQQLLNRSVSSRAPGLAERSPAAGGGNASRYQDASAIASRDVGSLRVVLKSVSPVRSSDGRSLAAIRCAYEFTNLETQKSLLVAMNAQQAPSYNGMASWLRSSLVDDRGGVWQLSAQGAGGVGVVGAGSYSTGNESQYNPAQIAALLARQEGEKTQEFDVVRGVTIHFVWGATSTIAPGQTVRVILTFGAITAPPAGSVPASFESALEIVTGLVSPGAKTVYALYGLAFDRVSLPAF
jgi:TolB-like protein